MGDEDASSLGGSGSDQKGAPSGWYPDPLYVASLRYWDGSSWTDHVHDYAGPERSQAVGRSRARIAIAIGGLALAVSPFLSWVDVVLLGNLSLFQLLDISDNPTGLVWVAVLVGILIAVLAWTSANPGMVKALAVTAGLVVGLVALLLFIGMLDEVRDTHGFARVSYGPWVAMLGCAAMVVGGFMERGTRRLSQ